MGRKNRNRIKKERQVKDESSDNDDDNENDYQEKENTEFIRQHDIIWQTRIKMIDYCNETAIPLCEYLDQDTMMGFIEFLQEK